MGIVATGSRAPILGAGLAIPALVFFRFRRARVPLILLSLLGTAVAYSRQEEIIERLERWSGEDRIYRADTRVVVDGDESKQFSSTRYRFLLLDVYRIALRRAGLLGFGTDAVTGFPVRVPVGPQEVETFANTDDRQCLRTADVALRLSWLVVLVAGDHCRHLPAHRTQRPLAV